jgi:lipopolysaccharide export LptBFGC system permease protein LptF
MVPELPGGDPEPPFALAPSTIAAVVVLSALLTWLDCTRHNEILFLTNLGVSRRMIMLLVGILPLVLSLVTAVLVRQ